MARRSELVAVAQDELSSSGQLLALEEGLYAFRLEGDNQSPAGPYAIHLVAAPTETGGSIVFTSSRTRSEAWLRRLDEIVVGEVTGGPVTLLAATLHSIGTIPPSIEVQRLDKAFLRDGARRSPTTSAAERTWPDAGRAVEQVPIRATVHIRTLGDRSFDNSEWAGADQPLWIEAFSLTPLSGLHPDQIEYRGLNAHRQETSWISGSESCGSRGMSVPLVGFAVRLIPTAAAGYDCEYSGRFLSGAVMGPLRNGVLCRSSTPGDPLSGIQIRIVPR